MTPARQRLLFIGLIFIGLIFVVFFGVRFVHAFKEFNGHRPRHFSQPQSEPAETDVTLIRDWMTIGYLSHAYQLPPELLYEALNIPPNGNERKSLKQLNTKYYPDTPGIVVEKVKAAILAYQPPQSPLAPDTPIPPTTVMPPVKP